MKKSYNPILFFKKNIDAENILKKLGYVKIKNENVFKIIKKHNSYLYYVNFIHNNKQYIADELIYFFINSVVYTQLCEKLNEFINDEIETNNSNFSKIEKTVFSNVENIAKQYFKYNNSSLALHEKWIEYNKNLHTFELEEIIFQNPVNILIKIYSLYFLKKLFCYDLIEETLNLSEIFKKENTNIPISFENIDFNVSSYNTLSILEDFLVFDKEKFVKKGVVSLKHEKELVLLYNDIMEKILNNKQNTVIFLCDQNSKIKQNQNKSPKIFDFDKKFVDEFLDPTTPSFNCLLYFMSFNNIFESQLVYFYKKQNQNTIIKKEKNIYTVFNPKLGMKYQFTFIPNKFNDLTFILSNNFCNIVNSYSKKIYYNSIDIFNSDEDFLFEKQKELNDTFFKDKKHNLKTEKICISSFINYENNNKFFDIKKIKQKILNLKKNNVYEIILDCDKDEEQFDNILDIINFINLKNMSAKMIIYNNNFLNDSNFLQMFFNNKISTICFSAKTKNDVDQFFKLRSKLDILILNEKKCNLNFSLNHINNKIATLIDIDNIPMKELAEIIVNYNSNYTNINKIFNLNSNNIQKFINALYYIVFTKNNIKDTTEKTDNNFYNNIIINEKIDENFIKTIYTLLNNFNTNVYIEW